MKSEIDIALKQLVAERNLPPETVISAFTAGLISAYKKESITPESQNVSVKLDPTQGDVTIIIRKEVVQDVSDTDLEIAFSDAQTLDDSASIGDMIVTKSMPYELGRIAAQTARQVMMQRLREAEREFVLAEYSGRENDIFLATILRVEQRVVIVDLGNSTEAVMPKPEQVFSERYRQGQKMKVVLKSVENSAKGPELTASRSDSNLVRKLFEMEVPEIEDGIIEIEGIARQPGERAKIIVKSNDRRIDPVGACVGMRGSRIQAIVRELNNEKIDIVNFSHQPEILLSRALSPATPLDLYIDEEDKYCVAVFNDDDLEFAIGRGGVNINLASRITSYRIDAYGKKEYERNQKQQATLLSDIEDFTKKDVALFEAASIVTVSDLLGAEEGVLLDIKGMTSDKIEEAYNAIEAFIESDKDEEKEEEVDVQELMDDLDEKLKKDTENAEEEVAEENAEEEVAEENAEEEAVESNDEKEEVSN